MRLDRKELKIETMRGTGEGGQHKNKTNSCVRITHIPTGISATVDGRYQHQNKRLAMKELSRKLECLKESRKAEVKKRRRDKVIHTKNIIRTYDFTRNIVIDHRTKKRAPLKDVLYKGRLGLLK